MALELENELIANNSKLISVNERNMAEIDRAQATNALLIETNVKLFTRISALEKQFASAYSSGAREFGEALIACGNEGSTDEWFRTFIRKQLARFLAQKKVVG